MEDLLKKLELGCLNDSAEKFFATQCNSKEAVCLLLADGIVNHGSTTLQYISGKEAACRQADFKVWFEAPLGGCFLRPFPSSSPESRLIILLGSQYSEL